MSMYKLEGVEALDDSDASIQFVKRINSLVDVMNVKTPTNALRSGGEEENVREK